MRLHMAFCGPVSDETLESNRRYAHGLGLKGPEKMERPPLAVVGGGPSVKEYLEELRAWPGDVWIACGAFPWCRQNGIDGAFFSADPQPSVAGLCDGAARAILSSCSDRSVFDALMGADVTVFDLYDGRHGVSTVTAAPVLALGMGHPSVAFFGCESSYVGQTHAYSHQPTGSEITVECGGELYDTTLQLLAQALCLSEVMRAAPDKLICHSGGLLAALVADPEYDVVAGTRGLYMALTVNGRPLHEIHPPRIWTA